MLRIGQKVTPVAVKSHPDFKGQNPVEGTVYTVSWTGIHPVYGFELIDLVEIPNPDSEGWYRGYTASFFRPVVERKTDISVFTAMLNPSQVTVDAFRIADHARELVQ